MYRKTAVAAVILGFGVMVLADFTADFQEALKIFYAGKNTEACDRFVALAALAPKPSAKSAALRLAFLSALREKQFPKAEELLPKIPRESTRKLCEMDLFLAQDKPEKLLARFKDERISEDWSDCNVFDGLLARGNAYLALRRTAEAMKDFQEAEGVAITQQQQAHLRKRMTKAMSDAPEKLKEQIQAEINKLK